MKLTKEQKQKRNEFRNNLQFRFIANQAWKQVNETASAPLEARQESRKEWMEGMRNPEHIAELTERLFYGDYGMKAYYAACLAMCMNANANKAANIGALLAGLEFQCPPDFARDGWKRLTKEEQTAVNKAVEKAAIAGFKREVLSIEE